MEFGPIILFRRLSV